jgi:hypothetical protein
MKKNMTTTRTASWQHDSMDLAEGLDNKDHPSYAQNRKYARNQWSGHSNDGRLVNKGRGPTVGNKGCDIEGPACPPYAQVPKLPAQGSLRDSINRGAQVRTPGGTRNWMPAAGQNYRGNPDSINSGRGPTKGNAQ